MTGPEMIVAVVALCIVGWVASTIANGFFSWLNDRKPSDTSSGANLTTSELEQIVERAVHEATRPLEQKIDRLEGKLDERTPLLDRPDIQEQLHASTEEETSSQRERVR